MDMFVTFINEPFVSAELVKSLDADSNSLQPDNIIFGKILSNFLGILQLQQQQSQPKTDLLETKGDKIPSQTMDAQEDKTSQYLSSIINKDNEDIPLESKLKGFPVDHKDKILDCKPAIFLSKEIYNYFLQSGESPVKIVEQLEQYIHELNNTEGNHSALILKNDFLTNDFISRDSHLFKISSPDIKESLQFIKIINPDKNEINLSDSSTRDNQVLKASLLSSIKEMIQFLNNSTGTGQTQRSHTSLDGPHISGFEEVLQYAKSGDGENRVLEKDVFPVFIKEIKSFLDDTNIRPLATEETLTPGEDIAQSEMSKDKGHEQMQMSNFNKPSGTEYTFSTILDSNVRNSKDFEISDKNLLLDDKQNNLYTVSKKGDASIEISIEPDGIGEIDIELFLDKGVINAQISASDTLGKEFFEKNLDNIMRTLINEGLNIGNFSVSLHNKRGMAMYDNKKEDIQDIRITDLTGLPVSLHSEGLISIFV